MILIEKEWQEYKDAKGLYKMRLIAVFVLLSNIGIHIYNYLYHMLEAGVSLDYINIGELSISWIQIVKTFNVVAVMFFLPMILFTNVGSISRTKLKNAHFFACGVSKEAMGFVKIGLRIFVPTITYIFLSVFVSAIANFFFESTAVQIANGVFLEISLFSLYLRPFVILPFMLMCFSVSLLAEQIGRDRLISIFGFFMGGIIIFSLMALSGVARDGIKEIFNCVLFLSKTVNLQKLILGELICTCVFSGCFAMSVLRYSKNRRI